MAFSSILNGSILIFDLVTEENEYNESMGLMVFQDLNTNSIWNIKGEAISGPLKGLHHCFPTPFENKNINTHLVGAKLTKLLAYHSYWFAATSVFPHALIWYKHNLRPYSSDVLCPQPPENNGTNSYL